MRKARLYEAILLVNRGVDEAIQGLERLKSTSNIVFDPVCFEEKVAFFELQRSSLNAYFCNNVERNEELDVANFEKKHREFEIRSLDEVQVYRDLLAVEERRRTEGKAPKVRFLTPQEQQEWQRQYPKPPENLPTESRGIEGGEL